MPRPDSITDAELARWDEAGRAHPDFGPRWDRPGSPTPDVFRAGCWLKTQLMALGCPDAEAERRCFANGQRTAHARIMREGDAWDCAQAALERYRAGEPDEPGPALALALANEMHSRLPFGEALARTLAMLRESG